MPMGDRHGGGLDASLTHSATIGDRQAEILIAGGQLPENVPSSTSGLICA